MNVVLSLFVTDPIFSDDLDYNQRPTLIQNDTKIYFI